MRTGQAREGEAQGAVMGRLGRRSCQTLHGRARQRGRGMSAAVAKDPLAGEVRTVPPAGASHGSQSVPLHAHGVQRGTLDPYLYLSVPDLQGQYGAHFELRPTRTCPTHSALAADWGPAG